jgi:hypothetical protein
MINRIWAQLLLKGVIFVVSNQIKNKIQVSNKNLNILCKTNKNDQVCKDLDYYNEFIQISNIINYEKNDWLELNIINKFKNIIIENDELLKELKEKVKELQYKNEYIDRYVIFKLILEFYLQKLENITNKKIDLDNNAI